MALNTEPLTALAESPFIEGTNIQYAWDSVSLTAAMACWRRYYYTIVLGLQRKGPASAIALDFGIAFHKGMEHYQHAAAEGADHTSAVEYTVRELLSNQHFAQLPTHDEVQDLAGNLDEDDDGITLRNSKVRTRYHLMRSVVWYLDNYQPDPLKTYILSNGKPATELSFRMELPLDIAGHPVLLSGHLDRVAYLNDRLYVVDYKTTKALSRQFFADFSLSHQITGYTLAGRSVMHEPVQGAIIDGIAILVGGVKFQRQPVDRSEGQIEEYIETVGRVVSDAERNNDLGSWPMNTAACYFCHFKELCAHPPEHRSRYIDMLYDSKPAWNPLESR